MWYCGFCDGFMDLDNVGLKGVRGLEGVGELAGEGRGKKLFPSSREELDWGLVESYAIRWGNLGFERNRGEGGG